MIYTKILITMLNRYLLTLTIILIFIDFDMLAIRISFDVV